MSDSDVCHPPGLVDEYLILYVLPEVEHVGS